MAIRYRVEVVETYAGGADRPWSVTRRVLDHQPGGLCQRPLVVRGPGRQRRISCGRRLPFGQQCAACRPQITIVKVRRITL
ncbi:hypothetical protein [Nonomuraea salmonea]|uniref:Uncharacterized protein n=1 Tax=Nonomuraea salmonea TaxID=46181 RepID=A0ABV5NKR9_9ACTN